MLGFFSFTEVTDPAAHRAYNEWHQFDHLPEQFTLDGVLFGQRWVCTPQCREASVAVSPLLSPCQYMTLYLLRDADVLTGFAALATRLRSEDRFFALRHSHLSGPFRVTERRVSPHVKVSGEAVPFRPSEGVYVIVGPPVDAAALVAQEGVAGAWGFVGDTGRHITVAFVDGDLAGTAALLGPWCLRATPDPEWAGPLERIDANRWDWFARLTPQ